MTLQRKNWKGNILRIWITIIRHGGLGHEVQEAWPYLSNATLWPYELSLADLISFLVIQRLQLAGSSSTVFAVNLILYQVIKQWWI